MYSFCVISFASILLHVYSDFFYLSWWYLGFELRCSWATPPAQWIPFYGWVIFHMWLQREDYSPSGIFFILFLFEKFCGGFCLISIYGGIFLFGKNKCLFSSHLALHFHLIKSVSVVSTVSAVCWAWWHLQGTVSGWLFMRQSEVKYWHAVGVREPPCF